MIIGQDIIPVVMRADLMAAGDQVGWRAFRSTTMPETCGVAIEVPEKSAYPLSANSLSGEVAANIFTPGAATSGCCKKKEQEETKNTLW